MSVAHINIRDCVDKCKSKQHGDLVCAALTKRAVSDYELCSYLDYLCCSCDTVKDDLGRTALHVAVSCGRSDMVKWLTRSKHANINSKDNESGYTPLHRSLFYGKIDIAVYLIKLGANLALTDFNGYTGLEHAMNDCKELTTTCDVTKGEVYVWGSNTNYTLGPQQARLVPDLFDVFSKEYPQVYIKQACLERFHCVLVSKDGRVFASGHGHGGRLGFASDKTVIVPKEVKFVPRFQSHGVVITKASIAVDHSVFLSDSGHIWTCGLNTYQVLGIRPPPIHMLTPYQLSELQHAIKGICAAKYHTVAWGSAAIYTWGLNAGQLGHDKSAQKYIVTPKLVTCIFGADYTIVDVVSSNCAIAVLTSKGDIYVIHEHLCRKIVSKKLSITSLGIIGGRLATKIDNNVVEENRELIITGLSNVGNLYVWKESDGQFCRCIFSINRFLKIRQVVLNLNEVLFVTYYGEAFKGTFKERKRRNTESNNSVSHGDFHDFLEKDNCQVLKVNRIPRTHRAVCISSDSEGRNFAVLQTSPQEFLTKLPTVSESNIQEDMLNFLNETNEIDSIQDVIFKVSSHLFPAHRYIISIASPTLNKLMLASDDKIIELSNIEHLIFEQVLIFIYTGTCDLLKIGKCPEKLRGLAYDKKDHKGAKNKAEIKKDAIKLLREAAKRFDISNLFKRLSNLYMDDEFIMCQASVSATIKLKFDRDGFPEYKTVIFKSKDGKDVLAHKCILAARMEYFNNLFSVRWAESSSKTELLFPYSYHLIDQLLDYLYTDELNNLWKEDIDNTCNLLVLADEFLITRLKEICEYSLSLCLTMKNVVHLFLFACTYNAFQLKICCMEFICLNLTAILELKSLEILDEQLLRDLTEFYCNYNSCMQQRIITPYSYAPSDEKVLEIATVNPISMYDSDNENAKINTKSQTKKRRSRKSGSSEFGQRRERQCSENDDKSLSISESEVQRPVLPSPEEKPLSQIQMRVKAITIAHDKLEGSCADHDYAMLPLKSNATKLSLTDFPELENNNSGTYSKSLNKLDRVDAKHKITRISQKERKRLSSESSSSVIQPSSPLPIGSPKNPWKIFSEVDNTSPISSPNSAATISSIMTEEKKQKENFIKMKTKLLMHTQIEDKAIDDLHKFYNVDNVTDEIITINRVQIGLFASPVWVPVGKQK